MALFSVSYDPIAENDYDSLLDRLEELDAVKVHLSHWLLKADNTAEEVKSHLSMFVDYDDKLMVIEFDKKPAYTKAINGTKDWVARFF